MAKNKKGAPQKKKQNTPEETKVAQNGTGKKNSPKNQQATSSKNKQNLSNQKHQNLSRTPMSEEKSSLKFWLIILLMACAVAAVGVVFRNEVQDIADKLLEKYIHPEVLVTREVDFPPADSQDHAENIPAFSDRGEAEIPSKAAVSEDSKEPKSDSKESFRDMDDNILQKYTDEKEDPEIQLKRGERKYKTEADKKVQQQSDKTQETASRPNKNVQSKPMVDEAGSKSSERAGEKTPGAGQPAASKTAKTETHTVKQPAPSKTAEKETPPVKQPAPSKTAEKETPPVKQPAPSKTAEKETHTVKQPAPSKTAEKEKPPIKQPAPSKTAEKETPPAKQPAPSKTAEEETPPVKQPAPSKTAEKETPTVGQPTPSKTAEKETPPVKQPASSKNTEKVKETPTNNVKVTPGDSKDSPSLEEQGSRNQEKDASQAKKNTEDERNGYIHSAITNDDDFRVCSELDEADRFLEKEQLEKAIEKYDAVLRKVVGSPRAHYGKGLTLDKLGFKYMSNEYLEQAIEFLARVLQLPKVPDELMKMAGRKLADRQQFRGWGIQSVKTFKTLITKFPEDVKLKNEFGVSYMMIGQNDRARDVFKEVLAKNPEDGFAKAHLGFIVKTQDNDLEGAVKLLREGIQSGAPGVDDGRFYLHLGDSLLRLGQVAEARKFYKKGEEKGLFLSAWQRSLYNVNGLTGRPWWTMEQTQNQQYLKTLKDNWQTIRDEGLAQLNTKTGSFVPEDENLRDTGDWKQFTLYRQGRKHEENCAKVPKTCALIDRFPDAKGCKRGQVKFSVMSPGIHVWPHVGPTNCRIRAHLGLVVPEGPVIRVVNETRTWKEGEFIIFDDSFEHEVWHEGSELRLVLIVDFWHPELSEQQKHRLSAI